MSAINLNQLFHCKTTGGSIFIRVCIPQIQRDYAEGRETDSVEKKRTNMLSDMLEVVLQNNKTLSLDFVYGIIEGQTFKPLDGQQRLTTLFVLHWLLGRNDDLKDTLGHSLFVYQTRKTSEEFCHWLVKQESKGILEKWQQEVIEAEESNVKNKKLWNAPNDNGKIDKIANRLKYPLVHVPTLFDYFMEMDDFKWDWHLDPNIRSMIVVMETAYRLLRQQDTSLDYVISQNKKLDNIKFEILKDLICDGDELFEKMNARGKALSTYDLLKSSLEEELELQQSSLLINRDWQNEIDNKWLNYCWDSSNIPLDPTLEDVKGVENKLENILIRMIGKTFFKQDILYKKPDDGIEVPGQSLEACIYKDCDNVTENYFKYARFERSKKTFSTSSFSQLNLQEVYDDLNNLIYKDTDGTYKDIAKYLHDNGLKMHASNNNTLLDDYIAKGLGHETRVIFYAMMAYLKKVNAQKLVGNNLEFKNFKDWMCFVRNVFTAANKNARIDEPSLVKNAINAIDSWLQEFFMNYHKGMADNEMLSCIEKYIVNNANGQEQERLDEEAIKAQLRIGKANYQASAKEWDEKIRDAENLPYLWGQIIALLSWANNNGNYDIHKFVDYKDRLHKLLSVDDIKLIRACLCVEDYRFNIKQNTTLGSLGLKTDDRTISWKRHLRDNNNGVYGKLIKALIDKWSSSFSQYSCDDFLDEFIKQNIPNDWRKYLCQLTTEELGNAFKDPVRTNTRYISHDNGNIYFYRSTQQRTDAIKYELMTLYLYVGNSIRGGFSTPKSIEHVLNDGTAFVELQKNSHNNLSTNTQPPTGDIVKITSLSNGEYLIEEKGNLIQSALSSEQLLVELRKMKVIK